LAARLLIPGGLAQIMLAAETFLQGQFGPGKHCSGRQ